MIFINDYADNAKWHYWTEDGKVYVWEKGRWVLKKEEKENV